MSRTAARLLQVTSVALFIVLGTYAYAGASYIYMPNPDSNSVSAIDPSTNSIAATIPVGTAPAGVAVNRAGTFAYVTNSGDNTVSVINTATNTVVGSPIDVGIFPYGVAVNPTGARVYVADMGGDSVSVIDTSGDAKNNTVIATIPVGGSPCGVAVNPGGSAIYVANFGSDSVSFINNAPIGTTVNPVVATIPVGSGPCGVAINPAGTAVYVTNSKDGTVSIIATSNNTVAATKAVGNGPCGVVVNLSGTDFYVANAIDNTVSVIEVALLASTTATNPVVATIGIGNFPFSIAINPAGTAVYAANLGSINPSASPSISVIDISTDTHQNTVTGTLTAGAAPSSSPFAFGPFIALADQLVPPPTQTVPSPSPYAYIPNSYNKSISVINTSFIGTATNPLVDTITTDVGTSPAGVAVNPAGTMAYVANANDNTVSVIDTATNSVAATIPVGGWPAGVAVNPAGTTVYVTNNKDNTVSVIDTASNSVVGLPITVGAWPDGIAVNPAGTMVYVVNLGGDSVSVINTSLIGTTTSPVVATITVGGYPIGIAVNPAGTAAYVTNSSSNSVSVIDISGDAYTNTVVDTIAVGLTPFGVVINPAGTRVYVTNNRGNSVSAIDTFTNIVITTTLVGLAPDGIAVNPAGTMVYVANQDSHSISVVDTSTNHVAATIGVGPIPCSFGQFIQIPVLASTITDPLTGAGIARNGSGTSYTITGTASGGAPGVQKVEVGITPSGGVTTWNTATDTSGSWSTWSYPWALPADGSYTIRTRATDASGNVEMPGAGVTVTVATVQEALPSNPLETFYNTGLPISYTQTGASVTLSANLVLLNPENYASLSTIAGRAIEFYENLNGNIFTAIGAAPTNSSGIASLKISSVVGNHSVYATYAGVAIPLLKSDKLNYEVGIELNPVSAPPLTSATGDIVTSATPTLSWQPYTYSALEGATPTYNVQISTSPAFPANASTTTINTSSTSITGPALTPGTTYYWRVEALWATGGSGYSNYRTIVYKTATSITVSKPVSVGNTVTVTATLTDASSNPLGGKVLTFYDEAIGALSYTSKGVAVTAALTSVNPPPGVAVKTWTIPAGTLAGSRQTYVTFGGDSQHAPSSSVSSVEIYP